MLLLLLLLSDNVTATTKHLKAFLIIWRTGRIIETIPISLIYKTLDMKTVQTKFEKYIIYQAI